MNVHILLGTQFAWGNISPYVCSYYRELGWDISYSEFYAVMALVLLGSMLFIPIGHAWTAKYGSKLTIAIGATLCVSFSFAASYTLNPYMFMILYAFGFGFGKGFLYIAPLMAGWSHIPKKKGLVSGIILTGLGFGAMLYGIFVNILINPDNVSATVPDPVDPAAFYFPREIAMGVPTVIRTLCFTWSCQAIVSLVLVTNFKKQESESPSGTPLMEGESLKTSYQIAEDGVPITKILASKYFW